MPFISLSKLLRFNLYYWCAIFGLGLLSSWQNALIHVKEFEWRYLPTMLASEMVAMLVRGVISASTGAGISSHSTAKAPAAKS